MPKKKEDKKKISAKTSLYKDKLRVPPHNLEAESSVLGSIMIDKDAITRIADLVTADDFYEQRNGQIFEAILDLYNDQQPLDILHVSSRLKEKKLLKQIGGRSYLTDLINGVPTSSNVASYARLVQEKATLRRLISAAAEVAEIGYEEEKAVDEILDEAEQKLFAVSQKVHRQDFSPVNTLLEQAFERIDDMHKNKDKFRGVPTGFYDVDKILSGLQKTDLVILAARPSTGKTSFALDIARRAAVENKSKVGVFSLEMGADQLVDRMLAMQARVDLWSLRTGNLNDQTDDFQKLGNAMSKLSEAPIFIDDKATANIMEMRTMARRLQSEKGLDLLIIDYLQLMEGRGSRANDSRTNEVSEISRGLKTLAKELNVPIVALSQLSRAVEQRSPQIPRLSDLRESGSIEQDADVVMFLYREDRERVNPEENTNIVDLIIAKHRNGPVGKASLYFEEEFTCFQSLDKAHE